MSAVSVERKVAPSKSEPSGFDKDMALVMMQMEVSSTRCIPFYTLNIKSWKASFYSLRKKLCPKFEFTFAMDKQKGKGWYNIWRTS